MVAEKILEVLTGFSCIKGLVPKVDILSQGGISIEPVEERTAKSYISGDALCEFEFKVAVNADYFEGDIKKVYVFFEAFKAEIETCNMGEIDDKTYALWVSQEGAFEMEHLSTVQTRYAVRCVLTYYKRGE